MLRSIAHISFYTDTQYDIQNWTGHTRNRYFSIEAILAHCGTAHTIQHSAHADTGTKTNKNTDIQTTNRQTQGRRKKKHTDSNDMDIFMEGSEQSSFPYILHPAISEVRGCPHITSANFGGCQTPPPPLVSLRQHLADPPSINEFKENTLFDMK